MKNTLILTLHLLEPFHPDKHPGIARLFSTGKVAQIGDNAFLLRTESTPAQICEQLQPRLLKKEFLCVFTASEPADFYVPEFVGRQINAVLEGEKASQGAVSPAET